MTHRATVRCSATGACVLFVCAAKTASPNPPDVAVDLLTTPPGKEMIVHTPTGEPFYIRLLNRAPSAFYRVTTDLALTSGLARPPAAALHQAYELERPFQSELRPLTISAACDEFQARQRALLLSVEEAEAAQKAKAFRASVDEKVCPQLASFSQTTMDRASPALRTFYTLGANDTLRVTVERLDPQTKVVRRTWLLLFRAEGPKFQWAYHTEDEWIVAETAHDLAEMAVYAKSGSLPEATALGLRLTARTAPTAGPSFAVSLRPEPGRPPLEQVLSFTDYVWSPRAYAVLATVLLDRMRMNPAPPSKSPSVLEPLLELKGAVIERENQRVSRGLEAAILDPSLHEQAAAVAGALALREASGVFFDNRRALCRMTAHLAMARALRKGTSPGTEADYAEALLLTLAGRQADALDLLTNLQHRNPSAAQAAWNRALRVRNTGDWRIVDTPASKSLLERLEWYRAAKRSLGGSQVLAFLDPTQAERIPDWSWIALEGSFSVGEGQEFASGEGLARQLDELVAVWKQATGAELGRGPEAVAVALNQMPARCLVREGGRVVPRVIDRGTWAFFHQRHLCHEAQAAESFLASALGLKEPAADVREALTRALDGLQLFPFLLKLWETRALPGRFAPPARSAAAPPNKPIEDSCARLVATVQQTPELVTPFNWDFAHRMCPGARDTEALPSPERWFSTVFPSGSVFNAEKRLGLLPFLPQLDVRRLESLRTLAPYDSVVLDNLAGRKLGPEPNAQALRDIYAPLMDYDVRAMRRVTNALRDDIEGYKQLYERITALNPDRYFELGDFLAERDLDDEAAKAYALGLKKALDPVLASNNAEWLVHYHFDRGRSDEALAIAHRAAEVYSAAGLQAMGRLMERMGKYGEAVQWYQKIAERYDDRSNLDEFYIRYELRVGDGKSRPDAERARKSLFPQGLVKVGAANFDQPPRLEEGLLIGPHNMTEKFRRFGVKPGDIIVALDGYRVRDLKQYLCVRSFKDEPDMTVIAWRDGKYVEVKGKFKRRRFGPAPRAI